MTIGILNPYHVQPFVPFNPSKLSGLISWYDAQDAGTITQSGGAVSQWNDKSPSAINITQATSARQPAYSATSFPGGFPGLTFDKAAGGFGSSLAASSGPLGSYDDATAYFVLYATDLTISAVLLDAETSTGRGFSANLNGTRLNFDSDFTTPGQINSNGILSTLTAYRLGFFRDTSGNITFRVNGVADSQIGATTPSTIGGSPTSVSVGNFASGGDGFTGVIGEIIFYNRLLTPTEIGTLESYLVGKW